MDNKKRKVVIAAVTALLLLIFGVYLLEYLTKLEQNPDKNFTTISILLACFMIVLGLASLYYSYTLWMKYRAYKNRKRSKVEFLNKKKRSRHS